MKVIALVVLALLAVVVVGLAWAINRAVWSARHKTPDTTRLHIVGETKRDEIRGQTLSGANVKEMSDAQLEEHVNAARRPPTR